jgi:hypothetical protein
MPSSTIACGIEWIETTFDSKSTRRDIVQPNEIDYPQRVASERINLFRTLAAFRCAEEGCSLAARATYRTRLGSAGIQHDRNAVFRPYILATVVR